MPAPDHHPEFLQKIAAGDETAFADLFHEHRQMVYNTAWAYTEDRIAAEEILQDTFVILWKRRATLTGIKDINAYIYTMARNRSLTVLKKIATERTRLQSLETETHEHAFSFQPASADQISEKELQGLLNQALEKLSPQQRRIFELARIDNVPRQEIATRLGIAPNTVSAHLTIALKTVRAFLTANLEMTTTTLILTQLLFKT